MDITQATRREILRSSKIADSVVDHWLDTLNNMRVLPSFQKRFLESRLSGLPSYWVKWYTSRRLGLITSCVEPLARDSDRHGLPEFAAFCRELARTTSARDVATQLGMDYFDGCFFCTWEEWSDRAEAARENIISLYCHANAWLQIDFRPDLLGGDTWRHAWSDWECQDFRSDIVVVEPPALLKSEASRIRRIARLLKDLGRVSLALQAFENWLGISDCESYSNVDLIRMRIKSSVLARIDAPQIRDEACSAFVSVLRDVGVRTDPTVMALSDFFRQR